MHSTVLISMELKEFQSIVKQAVKDALRSECDSLVIGSTETLKPFLSRKEAAELLSVSLTTLNDWSKSGIVASYKLGSRVRYRMSDIQDALRKQHTKLSA